MSRFIISFAIFDTPSSGAFRPAPAAACAVRSEPDGGGNPLRERPVHEPIRQHFPARSSGLAAPWSPF
jgi:hypothetical protein